LCSQLRGKDGFRCGKSRYFWQAWTGFCSLVRCAWNGNLARGAFHKLRTSEFFDQIIVDASRTHELDTVLETLAIRLKLRELFALHAKTVLDVGESEHSALAPDRVVAEIGNRRERHRGYNGDAEKARHTTSDSHDPNESRTDSVGQAETV
jgi:hypothetical protein